MVRGEGGDGGGGGGGNLLRLMLPLEPTQPPLPLPPLIHSRRLAASLSIVAGRVPGPPVRCGGERVARRWWGPASGPATLRSTASSSSPVRSTATLAFTEHPTAVAIHTERLLSRRGGPAGGPRPHTPCGRWLGRRAVGGDGPMCELWGRERICESLRGPIMHHERIE